MAADVTVYTLAATYNTADTNFLSTRWLRFVLHPASGVIMKRADERDRNYTDFNGARKMLL